MRLFHILFALVFVALPLSAGQAGYPKLSPFDGLRWEADSSEFWPQVRLGETWYEVLSINGASTEDVLTFCETRWGRAMVPKRFAEDLVEALTRMGITIEETVELQVRTIGSGEELTLQDVPNTHAKRQLLRRGAGEFRPAPVALTVETIRSDLAWLAERVRDEYAYRDLTGYDWEAAFQKAAAEADANWTRNAFGVRIMKLLAPFGDGHTRLAGSADVLPRGYAPFRMVAHSERIVALQPRSDGFLDPEHPYLSAIDGRPLEAWLELMGTIAPHGAPHFRRTVSIQRLHFLAFALQESGGDPATKTVTLSLVDDSGAERELEVDLSADFPGVPPRRPVHRVLPGNIGYVALPSMESGEDFERWLHAALSSVRKTRGLVLDVRGNGGGSRAALRTLLPSFLPADSPPRVVNIAAYRLHEGDDPDHPDGYLSDRNLWPAHWSGWSQAERAAIEATAASFRPAFEPPSGAFSAWHYSVISPATDSNARYEAPVVILQDGDCFSATDIFLGAFQGLPRVELLGTPSGGGSGRSRTCRLPASRLSVRLSSMVSFRPDGRLYDGHGIVPDVRIEPRLEDLAGDSDSVLEAALARLWN